jgi:hypothetical protein
MSAPTLAPNLPYPKAVMQLPTVRQSILAQFDRCALSTAMGLDYEQGWSHSYQARGQLTHRTFDRCLVDMDERFREKTEGAYDHGDDAIPDGTIPEEVATAILLEVLSQRDVDPRDVVTIPFDEQKDMLWTVRKWAREATFNIADLVGVEEQIEHVVRYPNPSGGFVERTVTGRLDALFIEGVQADHAVVLDWKDTWGMPGPKELSFDGFFQQRMYALLVMSKYRNVNAVTLDERYVRFSPGEDGFQNSRRATVFRQDMPVIEDQISGLVERLDRAIEHGQVPWAKQPKEYLKVMRAKQRDATALYEEGEVDRAAEVMEEAREARRAYERLTGPWAPSPGQHCGYCPRPTACPIFPTARGAGRNTDEVSAEKVAAETVVADAAASKGKASLKEWCDKHGPIPIRDAKGPRVFGHQSYTRKITPKREEVEREIEQARAQGREPNLDALYRSTTATRFSAHAPKPMTDDAGAEDADLLAMLEESVRQAEARKAEAG